jgi:hypothetical protein
MVSFGESSQSDLGSDRGDVRQCLEHCVIHVDNVQQHFVDPSVPLLESAKFMDAQLKVFNKICVQALEQVWSLQILLTLCTDFLESLARD